MAAHAVQAGGTAQVVGEFPAPGRPTPPASVFFGAILTTNSPSWQRVLPRPETVGALVLAVLPASPAEEAGIAAGDVIVNIDDKEVRNDEQANVALRTPSEERRRVAWAQPGGTPRSADVRLGSARPTAVNDYLRRRVVGDADPITRMLYSQVADDANVGLEIASRLARDEPSFAVGQATLAVLTDRVARERAGPRADLTSEEVAAVEGPLDRAIELDPASSFIRTIAAKLNLDLGKPERTETEALRAVQLDPASAQAHELVAVARVALRRAAEALPDAHRAVELNPHNADYYQALGEVYVALDAREEARKTGEALTALLQAPALAKQDIASRRLGVGVACVGAILAGAVAGLVGHLRRDRPKVPMVDPERTVVPPSWKRQLGLLELLGVIGALAVVIPFIGPIFGFFPTNLGGIEVLALGAPGLIVLMICILAARRLWRSHDGRSPAWVVVPAVLFLCGLWMTGAQLPLVRHVVRRLERPDTVLFHVIPGISVLVLAAWLYVVTVRAKGAGTAESEAPQALDPAPLAH